VAVSLQTLLEALRSGQEGFKGLSSMASMASMASPWFLEEVIEGDVRDLLFLAFHWCDCHRMTQIRED
jgi:hypothetical protein